jgi:hypothetical protein
MFAQAKAGGRRPNQINPSIPTSSLMWVLSRPAYAQRRSYDFEGPRRIHRDEPSRVYKKIYGTYKYIYTLILLAHRNKYIDIFNLTYKIIIEE